MVRNLSPFVHLIIKIEEFAQVESVSCFYGMHFSGGIKSQQNAVKNILYTPVIQRTPSKIKYTRIFLQGVNGLSEIF